MLVRRKQYFFFWNTIDDGFCNVQRINSIRSISLALGPGLAYLVYPEGLSQLPFPNVWAFLFFVMLFTVGLDTEVSVNSFYAIFSTDYTNLTDVLI